MSREARDRNAGTGAVWRLVLSYRRWLSHQEWLRRRTFDDMPDVVDDIFWSFVFALLVYVAVQLFWLSAWGIAIAGLATAAIVDMTLFAGGLAARPGRKRLEERRTAAARITNEKAEILDMIQDATTSRAGGRS
jgi:hypothetical protein